MKPNDDNLHCLNEVLFVTALSVTLTGTVSGTFDNVVLTEAVYKTNNRGRAFYFMRAAHEDYDPAIARIGKYNRISKMRGMEHVWKAGTGNQNRILAVEVGACNLVITNIEATWIQKLHHLHTFFTAVPPRDLLDHLSKFGTGLDRPAGVELILCLHKMWDR